MKSLESTYFWLKNDDLVFPFVIAEALERMHNAVHAGEISIALEFMQQAIDSNPLVDDLGKALIHIECARAANIAKIPLRANQEIRLALALLGHGSNRPTSFKCTEAIALWILGTLFLLDTNSSKTVSSTWGKSLKIFENLANDPSTYLSDRIWYQERSEEMRQAIAEANNENPIEIPKVKATLNVGSLPSIDILSMIPAGGITFPAVAPFKIGQIRLQPSTDTFRILDTVHHLFNLRGTRDQITLNPDSEYCLLEVLGDSMNRIGVEHENYVLLKIQDEAENGDIVASEINTEDDRAIIRTYLRKEDVIVYAPQSNNLIHHEYQIDAQSDLTADIHGVVLGVFKPDKPVRISQAQDLGTYITQSEPPIPEEMSTSQSDFIRIFPAYVEIPAGGPGAIPIKSESYVGLNYFKIDDQLYYLKNLRGSSREVNTGRGEVLALKVKGDSMDQAGIDDGDYVLLNRDITPESEDIVAAEIREIDDRATLKRYKLAGGKAILEPESSNKEHQPLEFDHSSTDESEPPFYIQGVAIAILKPNPDTSTTADLPQDDVNQ